MDKIKKIVLIIITIAIISLMSGCNKESNIQQEPNIIQPTQDIQEPAVPQSGGKIRISMRNPQTLNPILNMDKTVDQTLKLVFDTLVTFDENDQVVPNLAESWVINQEGTALEIKLKSNIKWHDGNVLTSKDVVASLDAIKSASDSPYKLCLGNIISYQAINDNTLKIVYKERFSGYAHMLYFPIIPSHIVDLNTNPIGTGPYKIESFADTKQMILQHNSNYFKGSPHIPTIEVLVTPGPESDLYSFDQGLIDVVSTDVMDWEKYAKNKKSRIHEYMTMYYDYIGINFNKTILQDIKTRQALLYAANRPYLLEKFYLNHGETTDVPVSPLSWLYEPQSKQYETDIDKAKELLGGKSLNLELLVNSENMQRKNVALALKKMYKDIGVNIEVIELDEETYIQRIQKNQYDLFLGGWNLSIIPDLSFAFHSSGVIGGSNYGRYTNDKMDQLLKSAFVATSSNQLKAAYSQLQLHIASELPYISLYFRTGALITNEKIRGEIKPHHMNVYQNINEWYVSEDK